MISSDVFKFKHRFIYALKPFFKQFTELLRGHMAEAIIVVIVVIVVIGVLQHDVRLEIAENIL